jgi:hypothetical protein
MAGVLYVCGYHVFGLNRSFTEFNARMFFIELSCKKFVFFEIFLKVRYGQHYFDILSQLAGERRVRSGDSPIKAPRRG